jgi:hypothetical protein
VAAGNLVQPAFISRNIGVECLFFKVPRSGGAMKKSPEVTATSGDDQI